MTSPANGANVSGTVTLQAPPRRPRHTMTSVQFLLDGPPLGTP